MAMQDRAIRTRQVILQAAAKVFEERGYQAATITEILNVAGVTKGALYFHFQSKDDLAQGVLTEQNNLPGVPERPSRIQQLVDIVMLQVYRLQTNIVVRAGVRLSLDPRRDLDRSAPFTIWNTVVTQLLDTAKAQGELLPHVVPDETAMVLVGSFGGVQSMSQAVTDYEDLALRACEMLRHVLPSVVVPSVLASIDFSPSRGAEVHREVTASEEREEATVG
ncbi:ScbR family autoregulator-binding transcription factor [Kitasatospora sp. NPDC006697]|uniref:ScbR family autoregulator-binding transcription factor n=1 Tax=Kitasatospora sp. NPDC006697 TaxID=3364020 RepID=UPI003690D837